MDMLKQGEWNNCTNCNASYSTYNLKDNDYKESWCELPHFEEGQIKIPKGLCQFCNPNTQYYNK